MELTRVISNIIDPALELLPERMDTAGARAMLLAIGLQESEFEHRHQMGGPAHGYWQFERGGGVQGVLTHNATKPYARLVLTKLDYDPNSDSVACYEAIEHNDILACCFARLLLWSSPIILPGPQDESNGWLLYVTTWRPGKPRRGDWAGCYDEAWRLVV